LNGVQDYLQGNPVWLQYVKYPLASLGYESKYDVIVRAEGGGLSAQVQAILLGFRVYAARVTTVLQAAIVWRCGVTAHNNAAMRSIAMLCHCSLCCCGAAARVAATLRQLPVLQAAMLRRCNTSQCCDAAAARGAATLGFGLRFYSNIRSRWS